MHVSQQALRQFSYAGSFMLVTIGWLFYAFNDRTSQHGQSGVEHVGRLNMEVALGGINDSVAD